MEELGCTCLSMGAYACGFIALESITKKFGLLSFLNLLDGGGPVDLEVVGKEGTALLGWWGFKIPSSTLNVCPFVSIWRFFMSILLILPASFNSFCFCIRIA